MIEDYAFNCITMYLKIIRMIKKKKKKNRINIYLKLYIFINKTTGVRQSLIILNHKICIQLTSR